MRTIYYLILILCISTQSNSQEIDRRKLEALVKEVRSVDITNENVKDLVPLQKAIGKSRVVILGEQDHGDATSMAAKTRLVKFLHDKMGFKVLAFESDAYSLFSLEKEAQKSFYVDSVKANIAPYWSQTKDMQLLWQYISNHKDLKIAGFDIGLNTQFAKRNFEAELYKKLEVLPYSRTEDYAAFKSTLNALLQAKPAKEFTTKEKESFFKSLNEIVLQMEQQLIKDEALQRQLYAILAKAEYYWLRNYREKHMAANLSWLIKHKYPNEKIIIWTASFHAVKDIYAVAEKNEERTKYYTAAANKDSVETMIQLLRRDSSLSMYVLNMIGVSGNYTPTAWTNIRNKADSISIPAENIEKGIADLKGDYYFMDLKSLPKDHWMQQPIPMIGFLHKITYTARWPKVFDGLFFIKNMQPLTVLSK